MEAMSLIGDEQRSAKSLIGKLTKNRGIVRGESESRRTEWVSEF